MEKSTTRLQTARGIWEVGQTCLSAGDEPTALAVGERTFKTITAAIAADVSGDGKISFFYPDAWANGLRFTAIGITNDGTYTVMLYAGTLGGRPGDGSPALDDCNFSYLGSLAFIIGQQASSTSGYEMAQSVTVTDGDTAAAWTDEGTVDSDRTCEARIDILGADVIVIVPTVCTANSQLLIKGF
jgi:hypothetical protein